MIYFIWSLHLPSWIHELVYRITGYVIVAHYDGDRIVGVGAERGSKFMKES